MLSQSTADIILIVILILVALEFLFGVARWRP